MRLSLTAIGLFALGKLGVQGSPAWTNGRTGSAPTVIEKSSPSGEFEDLQLQRRASRFLTEYSAPFAVDGANLPNISWDVGESYAGLIPISDDPKETRRLFFWFFPATHPQPTNDIVIWLNGGPGCSSMQGLLSENGPINWFDGTTSPTPNSYSWTNLTNVVWVDQPVGVGYSEGEIDVSSEEELAEEFLGFWKNFVQLFCMEDWRMYLTGESYAGFYIPYIAQAFINSGDVTHYNLVGAAINDPIIGSGNIQMNSFYPDFASHWNLIMGLNASFMEHLTWQTQECGMTGYIDKYFSFPPGDVHFDEMEYPNMTFAEVNCAMFDIVFDAAKLVNPCFNIYHITDSCPYPSSEFDPIDIATDSPPFSAALYFNDPLVRKALHVSEVGTWVQCEGEIFLNSTNGELTRQDVSTPPAQTNILSRMIEYTSNVIIGVGGFDALLPTNGTLMALQNVTWHGKMGFQQRPNHKFYSPYHVEYNPGAQSTAGIVGTWGSERGLTFYEVVQGGHELPRYAPGPSFRIIELMLGRISNLSEVSDFTTQSGNMNHPTTLQET